MYAALTVTGILGKPSEQGDLVYVPMRVNKVVDLESGPKATWAEIILKLPVNYQEKFGALEAGDFVVLRGKMDGTGPSFGKDGTAHFVVTPWTLHDHGALAEKNVVNDLFFVTCVGNLGKEPEMRYTADMEAVTNVSIATSLKFKDKAKPEETTWWRFAYWGTNAENLNKMGRKGSRVLLEGSIQYDEETHAPKMFTRKDGTVGASFEVTGSTFKMLGSKTENQALEQEHGTLSEDDLEELDTPTNIPF